MRHRTYQSSADRGFTLIEIMVALTIVMVLALAALPNVMGALKNRPLTEATRTIVNTAGYAKSHAASDFSAYGMTITPYDGSAPGEVKVFKGSGPQCSSINTGGTPLKTFNLTAESTATDPLNPGGSDVTIRMLQVLPATLTMLCFTPDGRTVDAATGQPIPSTLDNQYGAGDAIIVLQSFKGQVPESERHNVIIPFSGSAYFTFGNDPYSSQGEGGL